MDTRAFYASNVAAFIALPTDQILGQLAVRVGLIHAGDESFQIEAWRGQIDILKVALGSCGSEAEAWGVLIELPLQRLARRIDTVVLIGDQITCIEFKIGSATFGSDDIEQAVDYALCLRDFHGGSRGKRITPILCASQATATEINSDTRDIEGVATCIKINASQLGYVLEEIARSASTDTPDWYAYDQSVYSPTPDIVTAARAVYAGHSVAEIGRADASAEHLAATASRLAEIAQEAQDNQQHIVCFVTGEPGSGKTLLGLELVFAGEAGRVAGEPAALLSGNRTLVRVLQDAIALDARKRLAITAREARTKAQAALQNLLDYLKEHTSAEAPPPENVIVFDEAQRAWDAATGEKLMPRSAAGEPAKSEPEYFLDIMGRLDWGFMVCLVGPGQEINSGEGGLGLWGEALSKRPQWRVLASDAALRGATGITGLRDNITSGDILLVEEDERLHLRTNLRAYRNANHGRWVEALIAGEIDAAATIAAGLGQTPALITRDVGDLRSWLKERRRGEQRVGLLASSGALRLMAEGIPPSPRSNELDTVVHWFLKPEGDFRSSNTLEVALSEFVCQGLEVDYVGLCWGNDLVWHQGAWQPRRMSSPNWQIIRTPAGKQFRLNAYRVLLTRARAGLIIFVPEGRVDDHSLEPALLDSTYRKLVAAGCRPLR